RSRNPLQSSGIHAARNRFTGANGGQFLTAFVGQPIYALPFRRAVPGGCAERGGDHSTTGTDMLKVLRADIAACLERDPAARSRLEIVLTYPGFHAITA